MKEKSNIEHLRDILQEYNNDQAEEFLEAIENEFDEKIDEIEELDDKVRDLESENEDLEDQLIGVIDEEDLITIDTGIGKIRYLQPDNMKCQQYMEGLKNKLERDGV